MKKKKQTRKIKQWLVAALGLTLLGTGLWAGMNGEKLQAKNLVTLPAPLKKDENKISQHARETWRPITSFDEWQSAETSFVTREAPFIMMDMENTEVVRYSKNFNPTKFGEGESLWGYTLQQGPLEIVFKNVGYYNGHFVGTRVTLTPKLDDSKPKPTDEWGGNYFYTASPQIFTWGNSPLTTTNIEYVDVKMEFLEENDETKPMEIPAYLTYTNIPKPYQYSVSFPLDKLLTVLSQGVSTDNLQYQINGNEFIFNNNGQSGGPDSMMEFVFKPSYSLDYRSYRTNENSFGFHYYTKPDAMVQFPEPQGSNQAFEITEKNVNNLYSQFVQFIPYEEPKYRTQTATWITDYGPEIRNTANNVTIGDWKVRNELGHPSSGLYTISDVPEDVAGKNPTSKLISLGLESIKNVDLYNHYYTFQRPIIINYDQSIEEEYLTDSINAGNYQRYYVETGRVQIDSKNLTPPPNTDYEATTPLYQTKVNFGAEIEYEFLDKKTGNKIPLNLIPADLKETVAGNEKIKNNEGLVTWYAPLPGKNPEKVNEDSSAIYSASNAPIISKYKFDSVKLNGSSEDMQVKYSKLLDSTSGDYTQNNVVTLEYQPLYTVDVQVGALDTDGNFGMIPFAPLAPPSGTSAPYVTVQETTAPTPENAISPDPDADAEFTFPTTYDFEVGKSYKVQQVAAVNENYDMPDDGIGIAIDFSIDSSSQLFVGTEPVTDKEGEIFVYKDTTKPYILRWDPATKKLTIQMINFPQGDVEIEDKDDEGVTTYLADDIDFGNITVPTASTIIKAPEANNGTDKDQYPSLVVKDTRLKNYRNAGWTLYVEMTKPFRLKTGDGMFDDDQTIDNILKYKNNFLKDGTETVPTELDITKGAKIPIESLIPTEEQSNETIWRTKVDLGAQKEENGEASKGFYLYIDKTTQLGIEAGEYQAELKFSVENSAFTTSPGRSK